MFERTYQELQKNSENFKEVDKEELCKQYKKVCYRVYEVINVRGYDRGENSDTESGWH